MEKTLYEKIGKEGLNKLLNNFYDRIFVHPVSAPLFINSNRKEVQEKQLMFISQFLGGPLDYSDRFGPPKMRQRHLPHKITPKAKEVWLRFEKPEPHALMDEANNLSKEIQKLEDEQISNQNRKMLEEMKNLGNEVALNTANRIFPASGFTIENDFTNRLKTHYKSEVQQLDYSKSEEAAKTINDWVEQQQKTK